MEARVSSSALRLGFPDREYSKPCRKCQQDSAVRKIRAVYLMVANAVLLVGSAQRNGGNDGTSLCTGFGANMDGTGTES